MPDTVQRKGQIASYGGQAVIEGVMMRGSRSFAVSLRRPEGDIALVRGELSGWLYRGPLIRKPFLRGVINLWDALVLGTKALMISAEAAMGEGQHTSPLAAWSSLALGLALGVGLFILLPSLLANLFPGALSSVWVSSALEGLIRLFLVVSYIWAVGQLPAIRRVFAYHGAEHKTINAYELGLPLTIEAVQSASTQHVRCGTSFILTLILITVLAFAPLSQLPFVWRLTSRIGLLPVIAGTAYEITRLSARFAHRRWMRWLVAPNLALQRLTTREPDTAMLEVAIAALEAVLADEKVMSSTST